MHLDQVSGMKVSAC